MDIKSAVPDIQTSLMLGRKKPSESEELRVVAEQFEAIFANMMLREGRKTKLAEGFLSNQATETFQSLLDTEYASSMATNARLGIADALVNQFKDHIRKDTE